MFKSLNIGEGSLLVLVDEEEAERFTHCRTTPEGAIICLESERTGISEAGGHTAILFYKYPSVLL